MYMYYMYEEKNINMKQKQSNSTDIKTTLNCKSLTLIYQFIANAIPSH